VWSFSFIAVKDILPASVHWTLADGRTMPLPIRENG